MNPLSEKSTTKSSKKIGKFILYWALMVSMLATIILMEARIKPNQRGFFCDDLNLKYPLRANTYPAWTLLVIVAAPLLFMLVTELIISKFSVKTTFFQIYKDFAFYCFGFLVNFVLVDYIKFSVGRLRPHFFELCQPIMADGTDCSNPFNKNIFIEEYSCSNPNISERSLKEFHLSFPSGHSSFTFYAMTYLIFYIQNRWNTCKILKFMIEFLCLLLAVSVAVSRVSDYWHFWNDVIAGTFLGALSAMLVVRFASNLLISRKIKTDENSVQYISAV